MDGWKEIIKKPTAIGKCSRGFLIPKEIMTLKSDEDYIIRIIPKRNFYETENNEN